MQHDILRLIYCGYSSTGTGATKEKVYCFAAQKKFEDEEIDESLEEKKEYSEEDDSEEESFELGMDFSEWSAGGLDDIGDEEESILDDPCTKDASSPKLAGKPEVDTELLSKDLEKKGWSKFEGLKTAQIENDKS